MKTVVEVLDRVLICGSSEVVFVQVGRGEYKLFKHLGGGKIGLNRYTDDVYKKEDLVPEYIIVLDKKINRRIVKKKIVKEEK